MARIRSTQGRSNNANVYSRYRGGAAEFYSRFREATMRQARGKSIGRVMNPKFTPKRGFGNVSG